MCLSTVFMETDGRMIKIVQDIAHMEAGKDGFVFVNLFGEQTFVQGRLIRVDFVDDHAIVLRKR